MKIVAPAGESFLAAIPQFLCSILSFILLELSHDYYTRNFDVRKLRFQRCHLPKVWHIKTLSLCRCRATGGQTKKKIRIQVFKDKKFSCSKEAGFLGASLEKIPPMGAHARQLWSRGRCSFKAYLQERMRFPCHWFLECLREGWWNAKVWSKNSKTLDVKVTDDHHVSKGSGELPSSILLTSR